MNNDFNLNLFVLGVWPHRQRGHVESTKRELA